MLKLVTMVQCWMIGPLPRATIRALAPPVSRTGPLNVTGSKDKPNQALHLTRRLASSGFNVSLVAAAGETLKPDDANRRVRCSAWFGLSLLPVTLRGPVLETGGAKARIVARGKGPIIQHCTIVTSLSIGRHLTCVSGGGQEPANQLVHANRFGAGQFDRTVHRLAHGNV